MKNVAVFGNNRKAYTGLARTLDSKHGFEGALYCFTKGIQEAPACFYGSAFEENQSVYHTVDSEPLNNNVSVMARVIATVWEDKYGKPSSSLKDCVMSYKVTCNYMEEREKTAEKITAQSIVSGVMRCEPTFIRTPFDMAESMIKDLESYAFGFKYHSHRYIHGKELTVRLYKNNIVVSISLWIDDIIQLSIL